MKKDLEKMGLAWEEAQSAALNRQEWRRSVCGPMHPPGCRMNQSPGQSQPNLETNSFCYNFV